MRYLLMRVGQSVFLVIGISWFSFAFLQLAPGNFFSEMRLNPQISEATIEGLRRQFGLDQSIVVRYVCWLRSVFHGEMGFSFAYNSPVAPLLIARAGQTLLLTSFAMLLAWCIAVPLGVWNASASSSLLTSISSLCSAVLLATPELVLALLGLMLAVRAEWMRDFTSQSRGIASPQGWQGIRHLLANLALPSVVLVLVNLPVLFQHTASSVEETLASRYIWAARSHGIRRNRILFRHALPAALNPLVSLLGTSLGSLLSTSLLVEVIFGWPGIGPLLLEAILNRDFYVVIGGIMLSSLFLIAGMFVADLLLFVIDPRIRAERLA